MVPNILPTMTAKAIKLASLVRKTHTRVHNMKIAKEAGQSTIEFIFCFAFGVSIILLIFTSAMNYTTGYIVHYATFMASRAYLTADSYAGKFNGYNDSLNGTEATTRQVFAKYNLGVFNIKPSDFSLNPTSGNLPSENYLTVGTRTTFDQKLDVVGRITGQNKLELVSESFIGKEPTRAACATRVCKAMTNLDTCSAQMDITLFDDGC